MAGGPRRAFAPQQLDQPVDRDDLTGVQEQDREECALFRRAQVGRDRARGDLERTKEPKVHPTSPDGDRRLAMTWCEVKPGFSLATDALRILYRPKLTSVDTHPLLLARASRSVGR